MQGKSSAEFQAGCHTVAQGGIVFICPYPQTNFALLFHLSPETEAKSKRSAFKSDLGIMNHDGDYESRRRHRHREGNIGERAGRKAAGRAEENMGKGRRKGCRESREMGGGSQQIASEI